MSVIRQNKKLKAGNVDTTIYFQLPKHRLRNNMSKKMIVFIAALATLGAAAYAAYNAFNQLKDVDFDFDLEEDVDNDRND